MDFNSLEIDEAFVKVISDTPVFLYKLIDECYKCPFTLESFVNKSYEFKTSTKYGTSYRLYGRSEDFIRVEDSEDLFCEMRPRPFGPFGVYEISKVDKNCTLNIENSPTSEFYLPLYASALVLFLLTLIWNVSTSSGCLKKEEDGRKTKRLASLDAFRGLCLILMIFVNDGSGGYQIIEHVPWNGLHLADVLFPWFMWIMGVCVPISIKSQLKKKVPRWRILLSILKRSSILFLLGIMLNSVGRGVQLENFRIFGVLQRFAVVYFFLASFVTLFIINFKTGNRNSVGPFSDLVSLSILWFLMIILVIGQSYLVFFYPVPDCPVGYLGPGGLHMNKIYEKCIGGFSGYFDRLILGRNHLYQNPTADEIYRSGPFDPEGPFGCLLSIFQAFLGVQAGLVILTFPDYLERLKRWIGWGVLFFIFGIVLCQGRIEGGWIPINKNLWSLSFVAVTSGLAFIILSSFYFLIDHVQFWSGSPFIYPGMNSILLYVGHTVAYNLFPWHWRFGPMNNHLISMMEALWGTLLWVFISYLLYKKKLFLKL